MNGADVVAEELERRGVTHVFELAGGMIAFLLDALARRPAIQIVSMHHEQGAGFAAEGFARASGLPGVALASSGPGATNLLTALGSCYFDSTPAVFITGQVNRAEQKGDRAVRQLGFQETDVVSMARPIAKAAWAVRDPAELPRLLQEAFALAASGRPGPVLLDIPMDIQRAPMAPLPPAPLPPPAAPPELGAYLDRLGAALAASGRPLILAGGGVRAGGAAGAYRAWIDRAGIPAVHSLMGVDLLPFAHPRRVGLIGTYGNRWANIAVSESDLLIVLGSRLDVRQTGADVSSFRGARRIFHVDCDPAEMNNRVSGCEALACGATPFLGALAARAAAPRGARPEWLEQLRKLRADWPDTGEIRDVPGINPNALMHAISAASGAAAAYVVDVGQHQMWAAQSLRLGANQRFLTSGGMGAMGFALPAAIGACLAGGGRPAVLIAGDGGFQLNIQELQTVARNRLPLKMVVVNNGALGMIRQFQEAYFHGRYQSTLHGYDAPDFAAVAGAYGIPGRRVAVGEEIADALAWLWRDPRGPALLDVAVDVRANAYPKMAFGLPISEMEPLAKPPPMEGT